MPMLSLCAAVVLGFQVQTPIEDLDMWAGPAGLRIVKLKSAGGGVTVYLPTRFGAGDIVSGSIFRESEPGEVEVGGKKLSGDAWGFALKAQSSNLELALAPSGGGESVRGSVEGAGAGPTRAGRDASPFVQEGTAIRLVGSFDGDRETTEAWIDGQRAGILAEGPSDCVVSSLNVGAGPHTLRVREGGSETEHAFNVVRLGIIAPERARVGRMTAIEVTVDGLEGAKAETFPLRVDLRNNAAKLFPFGADASIEFEAGDVQAGSATKKLEFRPKARGTFSLTSVLSSVPFLSRL